MFYCLVCGCLLLQMCAVVCVFGWHDLDNSEYDCWPLDKPDELNMIDCGGLPTNSHHIENILFYYRFLLVLL